MSLATRLREKRLELQLPQEKVAELIGLCRSSYSAWETGKFVPRDSDIRRKLREFLEISDQDMEDICREESDTAGDVAWRELGASVPHISPTRIDRSTLDAEAGESEEKPSLPPPKLPAFSSLHGKHRTRLEIVREMQIACWEQMEVLTKYIALLEEEASLISREGM